MAAPADDAVGATARSGVFARVVVGVDGTPEALEGLRQAALLREPGGELTIVAAWMPLPPVLSPVGSDSGQLEEAELRARAEIASREARDLLGTAPAIVVRNVAWRALLGEAGRQDATLVVIGSHGQSRVLGMLAGSTTTELVHKASCSVLVARAADGRFPHRIVVGVDGSPESAEAYHSARQLAKRFDAELWPVVAHGSEGVDKALVSQIVDHHHEDLQDEPVDALLAAAAEADLLVVGSRGLHGLKALGSVSEQVAHRAHCSTLVVRALPR
jgi:nucleotide-binding universal stress UspA family protein